MIASEYIWVDRVGGHLQALPILREDWPDSLKALVADYRASEIERRCPRCEQRARIHGDPAGGLAVVKLEHRPPCRATLDGVVDAVAAWELTRDPDGEG